MMTINTPPVELESPFFKNDAGNWVINDYEVVMQGITEEDAVSFYYNLVEPVLDIRRKSYPPMEDYLDGVVKSDPVQISKYISECQDIKTANPLPIYGVE